MSENQEAKVDEPKCEDEPKLEQKEESKKQEGIDESVLVPHDTQKSEFMTREATYIDSLLASVDVVQQWHVGFLKYLAVVRAPILVEIQDSHVHLNDSQLALQEAIRVVDGLIRKYNDMYQLTIKNTHLYNRPLHTSANHLPCVSPTGQSNPGILSLAALTSYLYENNIDYLQVVDQLKLCKTDLLKHVHEFNFKPCYRLITLIQSSQIDANKALDAYIAAIHKIGTQKSDLIALTAKKRSNIAQLRSAYIRSVSTVWQQQCELRSVHIALKTELHEQDAEGKDQMNQILIRVSNILLTLNHNTTTKLQTTIYHQQYAPKQAENYELHVRNTSKWNGATPQPTAESLKQPDSTNPNFINVSPVVPSPIPSVLMKSSTIKLFAEVPENITRAEVEQEARSTKPPPSFPPDVTIVKAFDSAKKSGVFSEKSADLVYTKTHQIMLILHQTTNDELNGIAANGFPQVEFHGAPKWTLDGAVVIATLDEKKKNVLLLKENHEGFFSMNSKEKVVFGTEGEALEWMNFINNHNKFFGSK
jgi:hypothetical protein